MAFINTCFKRYINSNILKSLSPNIIISLRTISFIRHNFSFSWTIFFFLIILTFFSLLNFDWFFRNFFLYSLSLGLFLLLLFFLLNLLLFLFLNLLLFSRLFFKLMKFFQIKFSFIFTNVLSFLNITKKISPSL